MKRSLPPSVRRLALDWVAPAAILVIGIVNVSGHQHSTSYPGSPARHLAFLTVAVVLLGLRRWAPLAAPCAAVAVDTWWTSVWPAGTQGPFEGFLVLVGAAYCLGTIRDRRTSWIGAAALLGWFVLGLFNDLVGGRAGDIVPLALWMGIGFAVGHLISRRTEQAHLAIESARVLAGEQERRTERAVEEERARIARELHDVVAHGLSVIVVQAGAERRTLGAADPVDVPALDATLGSIEKAGRDALVDLRRLLGLLRRTDEPLALAPQPGIAQLDDLVRTARTAGLDVALELPAEVPAVPPGLDLTAYRIVQESLTNALKHANARSARVRVSFLRNQLDVEISDDGPAGQSAAGAVEGSGHGLIGMHERVKVFGGTLTAGSGSEGGWTVHARLPLPAGGA